MSVALWRGVGVAAAPLVRVALASRAQNGKEDPARIAERLGHAGRPRPAGKLVWVHPASVGESLAMLPLVKLLAEWAQVLVTSGTVTSAGMLVERLPPGVFHQYAPVDVPGAVDRFLAHWRPDLAI